MNTKHRIVLLHAYSRRNSGDGLLVDLSAELMRDAFGAACELAVVAADPASFSGYDVLNAPVIAASGAARVIDAARTACRLSTHDMKTLRDRLARADLIVGVGGGYLRARDGVEALKLQLGHLAQVEAARAASKPTIYLPQSIGPARACTDGTSARFGQRLRTALAHFDAVCVRDDRSLAFLDGNTNVRRLPDLAVLQFARARETVFALAGSHGTRVKHVALVLRAAPSWSAAQRERYATSVQRLIASLRAECRVSFAVQSTGRGNDDAAYYRRLGIKEDLPSLRHLLEHDRPDAVVSVRLHGALESLLHGVPAFHLSYERKGFGAYSDLGIPEWVANAADFDASDIMQRLFAPQALASFWHATTNALARVGAQRSDLIALMRRVAGVEVRLPERADSRQAEEALG